MIDGPTARGMRAGDWCILRTSPGRTLSLAKSLAEVGLTVWTPEQTYNRRKPRSKATIEICAPILPTFVFARAALLPDLMQICALPMSPHPPFSIFRHVGGIPLIADCEIDKLRDVEEVGKRARLKRTHRYVFPTGQKVNVAAGSFIGLEGVVRGGDGQYAMVSFGGAVEFKIATFLLRIDGIDGALTCEAP